MTTIVLSAGGTGGHLFPAQAVAAELMKRGRKIIVMTDADQPLSSIPRLWITSDSRTCQRGE